MYKSLLMFMISLFPVVSTSFGSQGGKGQLPEEISTFYSNHNYLTSLEAGVIQRDSSKPSEEQIRAQISQATDPGFASRSIIVPNQKKGTWAHRSVVGQPQYSMEIEKYEIRGDQIVVYVKTVPVDNKNGAIKLSSVSRQIHKWNKVNGHWIKEAVMIQQL